jgi:hypothetical protein
VRAGYGQYYALLDNLSYRLDQNGPFNTVYAVKSIAFSSIAPGATHTDAKVIPSGVQPDLQTPTVESWSLKIDQELSPNTSLGVSYIGSHGYHELLSLDANLPTPTICRASPCPAGYPAGAYYYPPGAALANKAVWNTTHWFSEGISSFNGLEVDVERSPAIIAFRRKRIRNKRRRIRGDARIHGQRVGLPKRKILGTRSRNSLWFAKSPPALKRARFPVAMN